MLRRHQRRNNTINNKSFVSYNELYSFIMFNCLVKSNCVVQVVCMAGVTEIFIWPRACKIQLIFCIWCVFSIVWLCICYICILREIKIFKKNHLSHIMCIIHSHLTQTEKIFQCKITVIKMWDISDLMAEIDSAAQN